jgi:uncharacterized repeat protein (TIGR01451 family)
VTLAGYGADGAVDIGTEWLEYTIRFQNTGTDTAFTVVLRDTLDADLEWESMQVLATSHGLTEISVDPSGEAMFKFQGILLPDSNVNEPGSQGFLKYRLRPVAGAPHLTRIHNTAAIYFDFNEPVITNTVLNTLVDCDLHEATLTDQGGGALQASVGEHYQWYLDGVPLTNDTLPAFQATVNGDYSVEVTSMYGCVDMSAAYTFIGMVLHTAANSVIGVSPNPVRDRFVLSASAPLTAAHRITVTDAQGRTVLEMTGDGSQRLLVHRGTLAAGLYTLSVKGPALTGNVQVMME